MSNRTVVFFGRTGAGKTSTINSIFGTDWATDNVVATTDRLWREEFTSQQLPWLKNEPLKVIDTPGIAESELADKMFATLYAEAIQECSHIVWVFQADTRKFRADQKAIMQFAAHMHNNIHFVIALNQVDYMHPMNWNKEDNIPSAEQQALIEEKCESVRERFQKVLPIPVADVVPLSAKYRYGLEQLYTHFA